VYKANQVFGTGQSSFTYDRLTDFGEKSYHTETAPATYILYY